MLAQPTRQVSPTEVIDATGRSFLLFGGCNYLGLAQHPTVLDAVRTHLTTHGLSAGASRTTTGNSPLHTQLERELADFLGCPDACILPDGYIANIAAAQAFRTLGHDHCALDQRAHPSLTDAAAAARLTTTIYPHRAHAGDQACVMTDGVFTADGSCAPVQDLLDHLPDNGLLLVDDCHGFAAIGPAGRGTAAHHTHDPRLVLTTTLAKGLGAAGGVVAGQPHIIEAVRKTSAFICTTPIAPALAAGSIAALGVLRSEPQRVDRLATNMRALRNAVRNAGIDVADHPGPIVTFAPFEPDQMHAIDASLREQGIIAPLIAYPGGITNLYFRLIATSEHTSEQIDQLEHALRRAIERCVRTTAVSTSPVTTSPLNPSKVTKQAV
jgi:7-keto-8-aminopelargonate synthetase-like enzyme